MADWEPVGKRYRNAIVPAAFRDCRLQALFFGVACALASAWPVASVAALYKCARPDGAIVYQDDPCAAGRELRDFERDPATVSVIPFRFPPGSGAAESQRTAPAAASPDRKTRKTTGRGRDATRQARNPAERKFLVPGIGQGEVVARIGRPDLSTAAGRKTVRWTYLPAPEDPGTITTLTFELGVLTHVERKVIATR
jgi:hypothetical protein